MLLRQNIHHIWYKINVFREDIFHIDKQTERFILRFLRIGVAYFYYRYIIIDNKRCESNGG